MNGWEISLVLVKVGLYLSTALAVGGVLGAWSCRAGNIPLQYVNRLTWPGAAAGLLLSILFYLLLVGQFNETGISGMFDTQMIDILWNSEIGRQSQWRLSGFLFLLAAGYVFVLEQRFSASIFRGLGWFFAGAGLLALLFSYTLTGHTADKDILAAVSLIAHVGFVTWWIGCVVALILVCDRHSPAQIKKVMTGFGRTATLFVPIIALYGIALMVQIIPSWQTFAEPYGMTLLVKLAVFTLVLVLAARHRYWLVPALEDSASVRRLKRSVVLELVLMLVILALTAVLSSTMGTHSTS